MWTINLPILVTVSIILFYLFPTVNTRSKTNEVAADFCDPADPFSCGSGRCAPGGPKSMGFRCQCPEGWMGPGCKRPCQDIFKSCADWAKERRCIWARSILPFFSDNCAASCGSCIRGPDSKLLPLALAPILEPLAWIVGRWRAVSTTGERFPAPMSKAYVDVLDIQISDAPAFDRPGLNYSARARSVDGTEELNEVGFITVEPAMEQTGFGEKPQKLFNQVAIEMAGNTGTLTIEEGRLNESPNGEKEVVLETKYNKRMFESTGDNSLPMVDLPTARRQFRRVPAVDDEIEERISYREMPSGTQRRAVKRYKRVYDYLAVR